MLYRSVPPYLKNDIDAWVKGKEENSTLLDCLWGELYGSINSAMWDNRITREEADYLFEKYLGLGTDTDDE
jgi:hypothetical protein